MRLTPDQEDYIRAYVARHGVGLPALRDDLVDHLCCVVEAGLGSGKPLDQLLEEAVADVAPQGLQGLERQTVYLLNRKKIVMMKKAIYLVGFSGALALTAGVAMSLLRLPGGTPFFVAGLLALFLGFVPLLAIDRYKVALAKSIPHRLKAITGTLAAVATGLSVLFKIMHLQGAETLLVIGAVVFALGFLPFLFFTLYKKSVA